MLHIGPQSYLQVWLCNSWIATSVTLNGVPLRSVYCLLHTVISKSRNNKSCSANQCPLVLLSWSRVTKTEKHAKISVTTWIIPSMFLYGAFRPAMNCFSAYRELTNYSNKFHVTFHSLWGSIGSSCCTMLECPPLWVEETPLGYRLEDVASVMPY